MRADALADLGEHAADPLEHLLAVDRMAAHDRPHLLGQRGGLVEDLRRGAQLADVVQQRGELEVAALDRAEAHLVADAQHQRDDAPGVLAARVGVLGLERLAHQQRGPAVGLRERDGVLDPALALARQHRQQPDERQRRQQRPRLVEGDDRDHEADRRERAVDGERDRGLAHAEPGRDAMREPGTRLEGDGLDRDLGGERQRDDPPGVERRLARVEQADDERRPERGPGVAEVQQQVVWMGAPAQVVREPDEHVGGDPDRHGRGGREQQEGGDQERLRGRSGEGADREADAAGEREQRQQQRERQPRVLPPGRQPRGQRGDGGAHRERAQQLDAPVAGPERRGRAVRGSAQQRLEPRVDVEGAHPLWLSAPGCVGRLADRRRVRRSAQDGLKRFRARSPFFGVGFTTA